MSRRENQDVQDTNIPSATVADKHPLQVGKTVDGQAVVKRYSLFFIFFFSIFLSSWFYFRYPLSNRKDS